MFRQPFIHCIESHESHCGASVSNIEITDLVFSDDAIIFAESLNILVMALEALH